MSYKVCTIFLALILFFMQNADAQDFEQKLWARSSSDWKVLYNKSVHKRVKIFAYLPDNHKNSRSSDDGNTAILIFPGGSYYWLGIDGEGYKVARYFRSKGYAAFVVRYSTGMYGAMYPDQMLDFRKATDFVKDNAAKFGVDTNKIGVIGFSAGGHIAGLAAMETGRYKPAFSGMIYPVVTMEKEWAHKDSKYYLLRGRKGLEHGLSLEEIVKPTISPIFVLSCKDDPVVDPMNSIAFVERLKEAGADFKSYFYERGGHGFGIEPPEGSDAIGWNELFIKWLEDNGY